jgi:hypothetical protein
MNKTILSTVIAVMVAVSAGAQEQFAEPAGTQPTQSVSLNIPIGASMHYAYEHPLGRLTTVIGRVGVDAGGAWGYNMIVGKYGYWMIAPTIDIEPRFYYGLDRREAHGRSTEGNAGSFISLQMKNMLPLGYISDRSMTIVGATVLTPMWGLRRVWGGHWLFECTAGYNLAFGWRGSYGGSLHVGARFGYSF